MNGARAEAMECRCNDATQFHGEEAELYAADHLVEDSRVAGTPEQFSCPDTGARWELRREDQPVLIRV